MAKKKRTNKAKAPKEEKAEEPVVVDEQAEEAEAEEPVVDDSPPVVEDDIPPNSSQERASDLGGKSKDVMVEVLPLRGIGGFGDAGHKGLMARKLAEQYVAEGYVKILDEEDGNE